MSSHLKLQHFADALELWQNIVVELEEGLLHLLLAVLQTSIDVIVITARLFHTECSKHSADHQRWTGCRICMFSRTSGFIERRHSNMWGKATLVLSCNLT